MSKQSRESRIIKPYNQVFIEVIVALILGVTGYYLLNYFRIGSIMLQLIPSWIKIIINKIDIGLLMMAALIAFFCLRVIFDAAWQNKLGYQTGTGCFFENIKGYLSVPGGFLYASERYPGDTLITGNFGEAPLSRKSILAQDMRRAIEKEEFEVLYQPICDLESGRKTALEALLRWNHPQLGLVSPGEFIPIAEETGLIIPLGIWVLGRACRDLKVFLNKGFGYLFVSVNISVVQLQDNSLVDIIAHLLEATGLEPEYLMLELTESRKRNNPDILRVMQRLHDMGVKLALDDFGTGYSSYSNIKDLPIESLKIDRSLISGVDGNNKDAIIVHSIIRMAHALGIKVIAEGIETNEQFQMLRRFGCDFSQGYYLGYPDSRDKITDLLSGEKTAAVLCNNP